MKTCECVWCGVFLFLKVSKMEHTFNTMKEDIWISWDNSISCFSCKAVPSIFEKKPVVEKIHFPKRLNGCASFL